MDIESVAEAIFAVASLLHNIKRLDKGKDTNYPDKLYIAVLLNVKNTAMVVEDLKEVRGCGVCPKTHFKLLTNLTVSYSRKISSEIPFSMFDERMLDKQ